MMDHKQIAKQMIQFNKSAFDNSFKAMSLVSDQNEKMLEAFLGQANWLPEEGRKALKEWTMSYKQGCDTFKKQVDENYEKVEAFLKEAD